MDRIASLRRRMASAIPFEYRLKLALSDLILTAGARDMQPMRAQINRQLQAEFKRAGLPDDIDFFALIDTAVRSRVSGRDEMYDDLFQEVAMNMLDRRAGLLAKKWVPQAKKLIADGDMDNLYGWLLRVAQNLVRDEHRKLVRRHQREEAISDGSEDSEGVNLEHLDDIGDLQDTSSATYAREVYEQLVAGFRWKKSREILDTLIEHGISGFLDSGRSRGGGVTTLAEVFGVSVQTVSQYWKPKFKEDVIRSIRRIRDPELQGAAARMLSASSEHPMVRMCLTLDRVESRLG